jgi:hypothetical protein
MLFKEKSMNTIEIRRLIRKMLAEEIHRCATNFILREEALMNAKPHQHTDDTKPEVIGDPVEDVDLNLYFDDTGSDEDISAAVGVKAGSEKKSTGVTAGQKESKFDSKK